MPTEETTAKAAKASLWFAVCSVIQKCIGLIVIPIFTRLLSEPEYGDYVVFQSWTEIAAILITLNLGSYVFFNGMMKYENDRDGFTASMLGLTGVTGLLWLGIFLVAPSFWSKLLGLAAPYVFLLVLRCIISPCYSYWSAKLRYEFQFKPVVALTLVLTIATPAISIPAIWFSADKLAAALIAQVAVMAVVYLVPLVSIVSKSRKFFCLAYWRYALRFNLPLIPHLLSTVVLQQCDRIMISDLCGAAYAAIYNVAYSAGLAMSFIHGAIVQALTPWMYQLIKEEQYDKVQPVAASLLILIGSASFLLTLFAPEVMAVLAPSSYQEGIYAIPPVAACVMLMTAFNLFVTVEYFYEETLWVMFASMAAAVLNVVLNLVLLPVFGFIAAGYTTMFCYFALVFGHYLLMRRAIRRHNPGMVLFNAPRIFFIVLAFMAATVACSAIYPYPWVRYVLVVLFATAVLFKRTWIVGTVKSILQIKER